MNNPTPPTLQQLLDQLKQQSLLSAADHARILQSDIQASPENTPLFAKILAAVGAWLAAWFLVLFLAISLSFNADSPAWLWIGVVLFGVALGLQRRIQQDTVFIPQFSLAVWIVGQVLMLFGIFQAVEPYTEHYFTGLLLVQLCLSGISYAVSQQFAVRWLAAVAVFGWAWLALPFVLYLLVVLGLLLWLWRPAQQGLTVKLQPLAWAVLWALPCGLLAVDLKNLWFLGSTHQHQSLFWLWTPAQGIMAAGLGMTVLQLSQGLRGWSLGQRGFVVAALLLIGCFTPASVSAALLLLLLGFASDRISIQVLAVVFLTYALWLLYYTLQLNLAEKSLLMIVTGLVLLGAGWLIRQQIVIKEAV